MSSWLAKSSLKRDFSKQNNISNIPNTYTINALNVKEEHISDKRAIDYIDAILYINLEHRKDRNEHCLNEIRKIDPTLSRVHRIDAVYNANNGALGCSLSHIQALELFIQNPIWKNCLILEDDFTFVSDDVQNINKSIVNLFEKCDNYDVLLLGLSIWGLEYKSYDEQINRIYSGQTTSAYIVNRKYIHTLLANYSISSNNMIKYGWNSEWCLDMYWKKLMPLANWYSLKDRIGYQYDNYSDIEHKNTNYRC